MHLQLTISLLVSTRIHTIRRCLDSLVPILMRIPSELIIVDTSEDDQVRNLALQYTDHVIPFHWCNDFSKARNAGLETARGEWFMYIDDDEWMEDVDEIVDFFSSKEYLKYNSASYIVRNYTNWSGTDYLDTHMNRMIKLTPEVKFSDPIHEFLTPYNYPCKVLSAYAHHYGYVGNIMKLKTSRNTPILEKELEEGRPSIHVYQQLTQEYMSDEEFSKAEECALKCLELETDSIVLNKKSWCVGFMTYLVFKQKDFNRALKVGKQMLRHPDCTEIAALRTYADLIQTCNNLQSKEKNVIIYAKAYHDGIVRMDASPELWFIQSVGRLGEQQTKSIENTIYLNGLRAALCISDKKSSLSFLQWLPWHTKEIEKIYPTFCEFIYDDKNGTFFLETLNELNIEDPFISIMKAKWAWKNSLTELAITHFNLSIQSNNITILEEAALLSFMSEGKISLNALMERLNLNQWLSLASHVADKAEIIQLPSWISEIETFLQKYPLPSLSFLITLQGRLLIEGILEISDQNIFTEVKKYCAWIKEYSYMVYNEHLQFPEQISLMPSNFHFALQMEKVFEYLENYNYTDALSGLRQAIEIYQPLCGIVRRMLSVIEEDMKQPAENREEFKILGTQVKSMIHDLIQQNRYEEALPLIEQLSSLLPRDLEVLRLRQALWNYKGE